MGKAARSARAQMERNKRLIEAGEKVWPSPGSGSKPDPIDRRLPGSFEQGKRR
jgi:hypothetical protein